MTMSDRIAVMNRGRFEQLGEPEELYERPATRFVAGFLGVSNLLPGRVDGRENGYAVVRLPEGSAVRVPAAGLNGHNSVEVGVRPEKIRLSTDADAGSRNSVPGTIRHAAYLGVSTQYIVELRDSSRVTVYEQNVERTAHGSHHQEGDAVTLTWSPDHTFVVAASAAETAPGTPSTGEEES